MSFECEWDKLKKELVWGFPNHWAFVVDFNG